MLDLTGANNMDITVIVVLSVLIVALMALVVYNEQKKPACKSEYIDPEVYVRLCDVIESQSGAIIDSYRRVNDQLSIHQDQQLDRINASHLADMSHDRASMGDSDGDYNYLNGQSPDPSDLPTEFP